MPTPVQILIKDSATSRNRELETNDLAGGDVTIGAVTIADGGDATQGAKADAANTATNTTPISAMSVWKQISASVQAIASSIAGTLTVATHAVTQSGTWTVQPGNTANTTAWKVDGSAVTQPVSGTVTANAGTNLNTSALATSAKQPALGTAGTASTDVITVQGIASGVAQPISGSLTNLASITTSIVPGTAATNLGKAEDAAHTSGDTGVMMLAVRTDSTAARSGTDGDYEPLQVLAGALTVQQAALTAANDTVSVGTKTTGGASTFRSLDLDETEEEVKATAGTIYGIKAFNRTAAPLYLKLYNATAASTTVGTTTPFDTLLVPANADSDGAGFIWESTVGRAFGTALSVAVTTGIADADTGAPGANDCLVSIGYA